MTKKHTVQYFEAKAAERNLKVIKLEGYKGMRKSSIGLQCLTCETCFDFSCNWFLSTTKPGCLVCKKNNNKLSLKKEFVEIQSEDSLNRFLKENRNSYNDFIVSCLENKSEKNLDNVVYQTHHIIPNHCGGSHKSWNTVKLTMAEHVFAHQLRWETYKNQNDFLALRFMQSQFNTKQLLAERSKLSHKVQKQLQIGRWNSKSQRSLGKKGGSKQTEAKKEMYKQKLSDPVKALLSKKSIWKHKTNITETVFETNQFCLVVELLENLIHATEDIKSREQMQNTNKTNATGLLARVIKKQRKSCYGWQIVSTFSS